MSENYQDYISQPNEWFSLELDYSGQGIAYFDNPKGYVEGKTTVTFDELGNATIFMEVENFFCESCTDQSFNESDNFIWLVNGLKPIIESERTMHAGNVNPNNTCDSLLVSSKDGTFRATNKVKYALNPFDFSKISFYVVESEYICNSNLQSKYWVFPLINFASHLLKFIPFPYNKHILDPHPLRVYPTKPVPEDLPHDEYMFALRIANQHNCLITFEFDGKLGFIERLSSYHEREKKLLNGEAAYLTTAVMIGEIGGNSTHFPEVKEWLPLDYLHLLSLASGALVGLPWIEFRDASGALVSRIHTKQWQAPFFIGHTAIEYGIGELLTTAELDWEAGFRIAIRRLAEASNKQLSLEQRLEYLFGATDSLTEIRRAKHKEKHNNYQNGASALIEHVREIGLKDFEVLSSQNLSDELWKNLWKEYRNQVVHQGYLSKNHNIQEAMALLYHLHDLLIRCILKTVGYKGQYKRFVPLRVNCPVDRVDTKTPLKEIWHIPS